MIDLCNTSIMQQRRTPISERQCSTSIYWVQLTPFVVCECSALLLTLTSYGHTTVLRRLREDCAVPSLILYVKMGIQAHHLDCFAFASYAPMDRNYGVVNNIESNICLLTAPPALTSVYWVECFSCKRWMEVSDHTVWTVSSSLPAYPRIEFRGVVNKIRSNIRLFKASKALTCTYWTNFSHCKHCMEAHVGAVLSCTILTLREQEDKYPRTPMPKSLFYFPCYSYPHIHNTSYVAHLEPASVSNQYARLPAFHSMPGWFRS